MGKSRSAGCLHGLAGPNEQHDPAYSQALQWTDTREVKLCHLFGFQVMSKLHLRIAQVQILACASVSSVLG